MALVAPSYMLTMMAQFAHALVKPMVEENWSLAEKLQRHDRIKLELVVVAAHLGEHTKLHLMKATVEE